MKLLVAVYHLVFDLHLHQLMYEIYLKFSLLRPRLYRHLTEQIQLLLNSVFGSTCYWGPLEMSANTTGTERSDLLRMAFVVETPFCPL